jgi:hypothetical protein
MPVAASPLDDFMSAMFMALWLTHVLFCDENRTY